MRPIFVSQSYEKNLEKHNNIIEHKNDCSNSLTFVKDSKTFPFYQSLRAKNYVLFSVSDLVSVIRQGKVKTGKNTIDLAQKIALIRKAKQDGNEKLKSELKQNLPVIAVSVIFEQGKPKTKENIKKFTGFIQIDFDHVPNLSEKKEALKKDPYTLVLFTSPSGDGLKLIVRIDVCKPFENLFYGLADYYKTKYNLELDQQTKNPNRLMFLSYDPEIYVNERAKVFDTVKELSPEKAPETGKKEWFLASSQANSKLKEKILDKAEFEILNAPDGQRHETVLKMSRLLGGYVASGVLELNEAKSTLLNAVSIMYTNNRADKFRALEDGFKDGLASPVYLPPRTYKPRIKPKETIKISPDYELAVKEWLTEAKDQIKEYAEKEKRILLFAPTGTGKTTVILSIAKDFKEAGKRVIIAEPTTALTDQIAKENGFTPLTGETEGVDRDIALSENITVATYDQASKIADFYDVIIIDEAHEYIEAYSYRSNVLTALQNNSKDKTVIAITATPQGNLLKKLDFKYLRVNVLNEKVKTIKVRLIKKNPLTTALNHILNANVKGKTLILINDKKALDTLKSELISRGLAKENEIIILDSETRKTKHYNDYLKLISEQKFADGVKYILATKLIAEGLNINDPELKQMVLIDTNNKIPPEQIIQFYARSRKYEPEFIYYAFIGKKETELITDLENEFELKKADVILAKTGLEAFSKMKGKAITPEHPINNTLKFTDVGKFVIKQNDQFVINDLAVLHKTYTDHLSRLDLYDKIRYLEANYKVKFDLDSFNYLYELETEEIDKEKLKDKDRKTAKILFIALSNHFKDVCKLIAEHTNNKDLRANISKYYPLSGLNIDTYSPEFEKLLPEFENSFLYSQLETLLKRFFKFERFFEGKIDDTTKITVLAFLFTSDKENKLKIRGNASFNDLYKRLEIYYFLLFEKVFLEAGNEYTKFDLTTLKQIINFLLTYKGKYKTGKEYYNLVKRAYPIIDYTFYKKHFVKFLKMIFEINQKTIKGKRVYSIEKLRDWKKEIENLFLTETERLRGCISGVIFSA